MNRRQWVKMMMDERKQTTNTSMEKQRGKVRGQVSSYLVVVGREGDQPRVPHKIKMK